MPTPETRWARLRTELGSRKKYPEAAIATLCAERETFQPLMLAELATLSRDPDRLREDTFFFMHIHLLALLAEWREAATWPILLQFFRRVNQKLYVATYGFEGSDYLIPFIAVLMPTGETPPDEVRTLLETPEIAIWLRCDVIGALLQQVEEKVLPREELASFMRQALARERATQLKLDVEARDTQLTTAMLTSLARLKDSKSIPLVQTLFDEKLINPCYLGGTPENYAVYMRGEKAFPGDSGDSGDSGECASPWANDFIAFIKRYFYWEEEKKTNGGMSRSEPKVGRNAPCPCGSGKKYKKCCGA
ncbi:MAG: DUF1186 domain-containing protein [Candidatus Accumulibacter sp.]|nr:DUF1186 domain-containing protein [Accumulibacter sp.]